MKSAYELTMERLNKQSPPSSTPIHESQKKLLAEIDSIYQAKIAEKELFLKPKIEQARFQDDHAVIESMEKQLRDEVKFLREEMEREKEKVRQGSRS